MKTEIIIGSPIDAYLLAFDETWGWVIDPADAPFVESIQTVYLFDRNERVHCCEMPPSHYLIHMYHQVISQPGTSEERAQAIYEKYEQCPGDNSYVHCHDIERLIKAGDGPRVCYLGETGVSVDDVSHDDQMEALREHYCANPPL